MNDQKRAFGVARHGGLHWKMALGLGVFGVFLVGGSFLLPPARDVLRAGRAAAVQSFGDIVTIQTSTRAVSEIPLSPPDAGDDTAGLAGRAVFTAPSGTAPRTVPEHEEFHVSPPAAFDPLAMVGDSAKETSSFDPVHLVSSSSMGTEVPAAEKNCGYPSSSPSDASRRIIFNEIAWMGSLPVTGENQGTAAEREWMELKNISSQEVSLSGWRILDVHGNINIAFGSGDRLASGGFYLLSRGGEAVSGSISDKAYTGTLPNTGDDLAIMDGACVASDVLAAGSGWPGGSNKTKQTLERMPDLGWQTSADPGGTPRGQNSQGQSTAGLPRNATATYPVNVMIAGDAGGKVVLPSGDACLENCTDPYRAGTVLNFSAIPGPDESFTGWTGACSGTEKCSFLLNGSTSIGAVFHVLADQESVIPGDVPDIVPIVPDLFTATTSVSEGSLATDTAQITQPKMPGLFIAAVQIAGASSSDDFVKIYNASPETVDIAGWHLRKKASTGNVSSLREFPEGASVSPKSFFVWASSINGFAASLGADVSSTGSLAINNSVALFDASGTEIDALAWGSGTDQYGNGSPYPENPSPGEILLRKMDQGAVVDTRDNASDFFIQNQTP